MEIWKTIIFATKYEISNLGNIKNKKTNKLLNINIERHKKDNKRIRPGLINNEGNKLGYYLHRIVAQHFIDNPNDLPEVNHIDGDFYNNKSENLEWISKIDNMRHANENNLIKRYTRRIIITHKETGEEKVFDKLTDCAKFLKTGPGNISLTCSGKRNDKLWNMKYETETEEEKKKIKINNDKKTSSTFGLRVKKILLKNKITCEEIIFNKMGDCAKYLDCSITTVSNTCQKKRIDKLYDINYLEEEKEENNEINDNIVWKEYPECTKYLVSNTGEVKNKKTNRIMMGGKQNGYRFLTLFINKDTPKLNRLVHRMVAQTFINNPNNLPVVNHKDTNILNNHIDNLEWLTYKQNMNTPETIKNLKKGKNSKTIHQIEIESGEIVNTFDGASEGENKTNIDCRNILKICHFYNGNKNYGGLNQSFKTYQKKYIFIFDEDKEKINEFLEISKIDNKRRNPIVQINKSTGEIVNTFESIYEASKKLNKCYSTICNICNYHKYTDDDRPASLKYYHSNKGFIYKYS